MGYAQVIRIPVPDLSLVERCRASDESAFNEVVSRYKSKVYSYIYRMTGSSDDAEEVLAAAGVKSGFIAIMPDQRVRFSRSVPAAIHQRLRNVLLN